MRRPSVGARMAGSETDEQPHDQHRPAAVVATKLGRCVRLAVGNRFANTFEFNQPALTQHFTQSETSTLSFRDAQNRDTVLVAYNDTHALPFGNHAVAYACSNGD